MATKTHDDVLTDDEWAQMRQDAAQLLLGIDADEFERKYKAGDYDHEAPDNLMSVLAYFPELD